MRCARCRHSDVARCARRRPDRAGRRCGREHAGVQPADRSAPRDVAAAAGSLLKAVAALAAGGGSHYGAYLRELRSVMGGDSDVKPDPKDRRFADPAWQSNFLYRRLMQAYGSRRRSWPPSSISPGSMRVTRGARSSSPRSSPTRWRRATGCWATPQRCARSSTPAARNLVTGLKNLVHDIRHNHMLPIAGGRHAVQGRRERRDHARSGGLSQRDVRAAAVHAEHAAGARSVRS